MTDTTALVSMAQIALADLTYQVQLIMDALEGNKDLEETYYDTKALHDRLVYTQVDLEEIGTSIVTNT